MNATQKAQTVALLPRLQKITAITVMRSYKAVYNEQINWHEFSSYLDQLRAKGILRVKTVDSGMTVYQLDN